ncbi:MAG: lysostaphin resistance A-like protein [Pseudooceanicola sp.]
MRYALHDRLISPASAKPQIWRLILGLVLTGALYFLLLMLFFMGLSHWLAATGTTAIDALSGTGSTPATALALLASFVCVYPGLWLALRWLHRRRMRGLFGPLPAMWRDAGRVLLAAFAVMVLRLLLPTGAVPAPVSNLPPGTWILFLVPALVALAVQITAEELVFRGYVQSQLAARFRSPLVWLVLPALIFGSLHYAPADAGDNALWLTLPAIAFGLLAADLTARCGNLGPALALHFLNNTLAILVLAPGATLSGLALWRLPIEMSDPAILAELPIEIALLFVLWLTARLVLRK